MTQQTAQRNYLLDMLKTIAITAVLIIHTIVAYKEAVSIFDPLLTAVAVPVFIIISAFLRAGKIEKIKVKGAYAAKYMFNSFMSLMLAYAFVVVIELILSFPIYRKNHSLPFDADFFDSVPKFLAWLFTGTVGFGSYYIPIMVQLIVVFPLIYMLFIKNRSFGLIMCFVLNGAYDLTSYYLGMHADLYRLLIFRFILLIGFGIYLKLQDKYDRKSDTFALICFILGLIYMIINGYVYRFKVFGDWSTSSMLVAPFAYGFVYFMMKHFSDVKYHRVFVFGRASYHIFLVQLMFFYFLGNIILYKLYGALPTPISLALQCITSIIFTFSLGYLFYRFETKLRRRLNIGH